MAGWHTDPNLVGRFHPQHPSDVQIVIHEGSSRFTQASPEIVWVRIYSKFIPEYALPIRVYAATLLYQPIQLKSLKMGQQILFVADKGFPYPLIVTEEYLRERANYDITPCNRCGLPELLDPISKVIEHSFSGIKDLPSMLEEGFPLFTSLCPACGPKRGGVLVVKHRGMRGKAPEPSSPNTGA